LNPDDLNSSSSSSRQSEEEEKKAPEKELPEINLLTRYERMDDLMNGKIKPEDMMLRTKKSSPSESEEEEEEVKYP
jgi:hypothetical protein